MDSLKWSQLQAQGIRHRDQRSLARVVGRTERQRHDSANASDVDYTAIARRDEKRDERLSHTNWTEEVDLEEGTGIR